MIEEQKYFSGSTESFNSGVHSDIRFKLACDILRGPLLQPLISKCFEANTTTDQDCNATAAFALGIARSLVQMAEESGLLKSPPDTAELSARDRLAIERQVRIQMFGQSIAPRIQQEEAPKIATGQGAVIR